jgi:hypothetical protein
MKERPVMSLRCCVILGSTLLLASAGCHGSNPATSHVDAGIPDVDFSLCVGGDAAPYMAGTVTPSSSGAYQATLVSVQTTSAGGPPVDVPAVGVSTFNLTIADSTGGVPVGMTVTSDKPYMPLHRHYASVAPVVTSTQAGTFVISNISFFQPGDFELTLHLQVAPSGDDGGADDGGADDGGSPAATTTDKIVLEICVPS